jgi:ferredoxin
MKTSITRDLCIGCGLCAEICPQIYAIADDMTAYILLDRIPAELETIAQEAGEACPVSAINF